MGQYFKPINLDKQEYTHPGDYGSGTKLMEHSWYENEMVNAIVQILGPGGKWNHTRLVWAGDYMDDDAFTDSLEDIAEKQTLYNYATDPDVGRFKKIKPIFGDGPILRYLVNHTNNEYVDLKKLPIQEEGWIIHPLPLLTCSGNGRGGGDFRGRNDYIETWAGSVISAAYQKPENMKEICPDFVEE